MSKSLRKSNEEDAARREADALRKGHHFKILWSLHYSHGPLYFPSLDAARQKRDDMIHENEIEIPMDYYDRQAHLVKLSISVHQYTGKGWALVPGEDRECATDVQYADGRPPPRTPIVKKHRSAGAGDG